MRSGVLAVIDGLCNDYIASMIDAVRTAVCCWYGSLCVYVSVCVGVEANDRHHHHWLYFTRVKKPVVYNINRTFPFPVSSQCMRLVDSNYRIFFIVSNALFLLILSISSQFVSSSVYNLCSHLMHLHKILFKTMSLR